MDKREYAYTNPSFPTQTVVTEWIAEDDGMGQPRKTTTTYVIGRDTASIKPRLQSRSGECSACGLSPQTTFEYVNHPLLPSAMIDSKGTRTEYVYDANGRMTQKTEAVSKPEQRITEYAYDASFPGLQTLVEMPSTSGAGIRQTQSVYDSATSVMTSRTISGVEAGASFSYSTAFTHNTSGETLSIDPPGFTTTDQTSFTYLPDRNGHVPDSRTDPLVGTTLFGYDGYNRRTLVTDPNTVQTATEYDDLNRVTRVTQGAEAPPSDDLVTEYFYDCPVGSICGPFRDLRCTELPRGNAIKYEYDLAGRLVAMERASSCDAAATPIERMQYTLDLVGHRVVEESQRPDGLGGWITESKTESVYKSRCHLDLTTQGAGSAAPSTTEYCYDSNKNLIKVWDPNHPSAGQTAPPTTEYGYDPLDRLIETKQPWSGGGFATTAYQYDVQDHLKKVTDAEANVTDYVTSDRDLMTSQVSTVSGTTAYEYNEHGALIETTDARGVVVTRTVDALDRTLLEDYPTTSLDTSYLYDTSGPGEFFKGRLKSMSRDGETIAYNYDRFGRLLQDGSLAHTYDGNGNRVTTTYPGGLVAAWTFDDADRETSLTISGDGIVSPIPLASAATYKPFGPLTGLTLGNGLTESRLFDPRYFPDRITVPTKLDWDYAVDAVGNPTQIADGGIARVFAYQDPQYFLTQGDGPWGARSFSYDKIGNRLTHSRTAEPTATYSYAGSGHNPKLATVTPAPGWGSSNWSYSYDAAGNQTEVAESNDEGLQQITFYDPNDTGQLAALHTDTGPSRTDLLYDARNFLREAHLTVTGSNDFIRVTPTYSSDGVLMAKREEREWTGSQIGVDGEDETIVAASDLTTEVLYFAGRPIALRTEEDLLYLVTDHLATPILATDAGGVTVWLGGLEPFGAPWTEGADRPDPEAGTSATGPQRRGLARLAEALSQLPSDRVFLRYPGQWTSDAFKVAGSQSEVYYNLHRWLAVSTGRYSRPDPLGIKPAINFYLYVGANPARWFDPMGLCRVCCTESADRLRAGAKAANDRANDLLQTGGFDVSLGSGPVGATWCGQGTPTTTFDPDRFGRLGPCEKECTRVHEASHAWVCRRFGMITSDALSARDEGLAYQTQAICLLIAARKGCIDGGQEFPDLGPLPTP